MDAITQKIHCTSCILVLHHFPSDATASRVFNVLAGVFNFHRSDRFALLGFLGKHGPSNRTKPLNVYLNA